MSEIYKLPELMHTINKLKHRCTGNNIPRDFVLLITLSDLLCEKDGKVNIGDMSERMYMPMAAMSKAISAAEEKGYIERFSLKGDRRAVYVRLTASGRQFLADSKAGANAMLSRIAERMGEDDADEMVRLMERFVEVIKEEEADETDRKVH